MTAAAAAHYRGSRIDEAVRSAAGMWELGLKTVRLAVRPPFTWRRDMIDEVAGAIRRSLIPLIVAHSVYVIGFGMIMFGAVVGSLGVIDRQPGAILLIWDREIATWISAMIFAGIVGSATTADLGARRIREELDALSVLGIDAVRKLVVPRVLAMTFIAPIFATLALLTVLLVNFITGPPHLGFSHGVYVDSVVHQLYSLDLLATVFLKNLIIGFLVGVIACHKGLTCKLGSEGVGRAVNQTVVLAFFGIWLFNSLYNLGYMSIFPDLSIPRG